MLNWIKKEKRQDKISKKKLTKKKKRLKNGRL